MANLGSAAVPTGDDDPQLGAAAITTVPWPSIPRGEVSFTDEPEAMLAPEYVTGQLWPRGGDEDTGQGYVHHQSMMAKVWTVEHRLGKHPVVAVEDAVGNVVYGTIQHTTDDVLTLTFNAAFTGRANCI